MKALIVAAGLVLAACTAMPEPAPHAYATLERDFAGLVRELTELGRHGAIDPDTLERADLLIGMGDAALSAAALQMTLDGEADPNLLGAARGAMRELLQIRDAARKRRGRA